MSGLLLTSVISGNTTRVVMGVESYYTFLNTHLFNFDSAVSSQVCLHNLQPSYVQSMIMFHLLLPSVSHMAVFTLTARANCINQDVNNNSFTQYINLLLWGLQVLPIIYECFHSVCLHHSRGVLVHLSSSARPSPSSVMSV